MIRTLAVALYMVLMILLVAPWFILHAALSGRIQPLYSLGVWFLRSTLRLAGIRIHTRGLQNIPPGVCVFAANHVSNVDPPVLVVAIPRRVSLLAKKEIFRVPIVSSALRVAKIVPVDRSDREAAVASVRTAVQHLQAGISFLVFPEGTRSPDGRLRPFKRGVFVMAMDAGVPIVPVSLIGTQHIQPKGKLTIRPGVITVSFAPPLNAAAYRPEQRAALAQDVEQQIARGLPPDQQPMAQDPAGQDALGQHHRS